MGNNVILWGDGSPRRQFTFSEDLGDVLVKILFHYNGEHPINVGNKEELSIKEVANIIAEVTGFDGRIIWDTSQPAGQARKNTDFAKFESLGILQEFTNFREAIKKTYNWFEKTYPNVKGIK